MRCVRGDGAIGVARKVKAKCMKTHWETRRWMTGLMDDLVGQVDARSVVDEIILNSYKNLPVIVGESQTAIERGCEENAVVGGLGESLGVDGENIV